MVAIAAWVAWFGFAAAPATVASAAVPPGQRPVAAPAPTAAAPAPSVRKPKARTSIRSERALAPSPPHADVALDLVAPTTLGPWSMRVVNRGDVPVRFIADARFLTLDVTPRSARRPVRCRLPDDMRPGDPLERMIVLPPKREFVERFEPRLYCFGTQSLDALAPGAIVIAHLGARSPTGAGAGPDEIATIEGVEPVVGPTHVLDSPPIALPDEPSAHLAPARASTEPLLDVPKLGLGGPAAVDARSIEEVEIPVTLRNEETIPVTVRFRPEMLGFDVEAPTAYVRCSWPVLPSAAARDFFTTLAPKGIARLSVLLQSYCPDPVFDRGGLLIVRPWLDTREASGASVGLRTFEGHISAPEPTLIRLRRGIHPEPLVRPRTEEIESAPPGDANR